MLSQTASYAIIALGYIARMEGKPILVKSIANDVQLPGPFLSKLINILSRKGIVKTQRGIGGGVTLNCNPNELTLFDVCVALDDPVAQKKCFLGLEECSDERACPAHAFWSKHRDQKIHFLQTTTLLDIADFEERKLLNIE
ncbi:MAG: Rrf2 family iron-sulfur cluster assembly transcriptional regulator [bacterium]|jgi:Rrf2 family iron-sulfur cluster assembly transcriptional regulator